ncbi:MAG: OadG family protein [Victivallaceae bacterium]|nr:OadG family protein [Victivallaceae bacterium]
MSNAELLTAGIKLMVCGMGIVFVFLVLMVGAMNLLRVALAPLAARLEENQKQSGANGKKADDAALIAAAVAAVDLEIRNK